MHISKHIIIHISGPLLCGGALIQHGSQHRARGSLGERGGSSPLPLPVIVSRLGGLGSHPSEYPLGWWVVGADPGRLSFLRGRCDGEDVLVSPYRASSLL